MAQKWYAFKNAADQSNEVELFLYNDIGGYGTRAEEFVKELKEYKGRALNVRINSLGGEIIQGNAIYNALERHQGGVTVHIDGVAASMASVIAMVGKPVRMASNAMLMIHNPWTMAAGEASDLRKQADVLDAMKAGIVNAYKKKTGMDESEISSLMDEERWLNAEEAKEMGFVDAIEEGFAMAASAADYRAQFDTFRKARMENSIIPEAEVSAPAAETVAEETPVASEVVETPAPSVEEPEQKEAEPAAEEPKSSVSASELINKLSELASEKAAAIARAETAEAELAKLNEAFNALQKGAGVAPAAVVAELKNEAPADPVEQFRAASEAKDWKLCAQLYANHKAAILAARK